MKKNEKLKSELFLHVNEYLQKGNNLPLEKYCETNSNLPGPRGNLELAYAFSEVVEQLPGKDQKQLFTLFEKWMNIDIQTAPVNNPKEFLVFCGVHSIGKIGSILDAYRTIAIKHLRTMSQDKRWRTREAVCMGLQFMLEKRPKFVIENFSEWLKNKNFLELRAIATAYADPKLLKRKVISQNGLKMHRKIFDIVIESKNRKNDEFKTLRKALGFTFSLIAVIYTPNSFGVMKKLLELNDKDLTWIVKENVKKNRLIKNFPERVEEINNILRNK